MPGMTANVSVIAKEKIDVFKVSNAALRFKPSPDFRFHGNGQNLIRLDETLLQTRRHFGFMTARNSSPFPYL